MAAVTHARSFSGSSIPDPVLQKNPLRELPEVQPIVPLATLESMGRPARKRLPTPADVAAENAAVATAVATETVPGAALSSGVGTGASAVPVQEVTETPAVEEPEESRETTFTVDAQ